MNSKLIFFIAFLAISVGLYGLSDLLLNNEQQVQVQTQTLQLPVKKIQVYFAKSSLTPGDKITLSDLDKQLLQEKEANRLGISENISLALVKGTVANTAILPGDVVTAEMLTRPDQTGYLDLVIDDNYVPYAIKVDSSAVVGGVISSGTLVDVLAIASEEENLATTPDIDSYKSLSITPLLIAVKVLQVKRKEIEATRRNPATEEVHLILELTRKQIAKLTIAKRISLLEVQKSAATDRDLALRKSELKANAGDVIEDYKAIRSFRADKVSIN